MTTKFSEPAIKLATCISQAISRSNPTGADIYGLTEPPLNGVTHLLAGQIDEFITVLHDTFMDDVRDTLKDELRMEMLHLISLQKPAAAPVANDAVFSNDIFANCTSEATSDNSVSTNSIKMVTRTLTDLINVINNTITDINKNTNDCVSTPANDCIKASTNEVTLVDKCDASSKQISVSDDSSTDVNFTDDIPAQLKNNPIFARVERQLARKPSSFDTPVIAREAMRPRSHLEDGTENPNFREELDEYNRLNNDTRMQIMYQSHGNWYKYDPGNDNINNDQTNAKYSSSDSTISNNDILDGNRINDKYRTYWGC